MKQTSATLLLASLFCAVLALAQGSPQAPTPSPELKKQDFFVGTWKLEGTTKSSPYGPGGQKFESAEQLEWMPGGFFLLARSYSDKKLTGITVIGYDPKEQVFTHSSFESTGRTELWKGTAEDDTWTWTRDGIGGKPVKVRLTIKKTSSNSYSFVQDVKPAEGGDWSIVAEGTGTKTK